MPIFHLHIASPIFGLFINVMSQLSVCRYSKKMGVLKSVFLGFFCGFLMLLIVETVYFFSTKSNVKVLSSQLALNIITYVALGYCYFHFINLGETARRIRIIRELWESKKGLSMDELLERYNALDIVNARIQRMIHNKQIVCRTNRYYVGKPIMLYIANLLVVMKLMLFNKKSEYQ